MMAETLLAFVGISMAYFVWVAALKILVYGEGKE